MASTRAQAKLVRQPRTAATLPLSHPTLDHSVASTKSS
jgi:hypothetical protein